MKILQVHNKYQLPGGEDSVLQSEFELLSSSEHNVDQFIVSNDSINSFLDKIKLALTTHYSRSSYKKFKAVLKDKKPDIVHVHNFFPLLTPSIFKACEELNIPSVMTLHNYRLIDPSAILMKDGKVYEKSVKSSAFNSIFDRVYRNSVFQTAVVAFMIEFHRKKRTWFKTPDKLIVLTEFAKKKFAEGGIPYERMTIKPNFVFDKFSQKDKRNNDFIYVGRLSSEKGIKTLLKCWEKIDDSNLLIVGDGPLSDLVKSYSNCYKNINWIGQVSRNQALDLISSSKALVLPSICYEGFPMALVEAMACGTPIVSSNIGSQNEIVEEGVSGLKFSAGNHEDLRKKVADLRSNQQLQKSLSDGAREQYLSNYTPERNLEILIGIYESIRKN